MMIKEKKRRTISGKRNSVGRMMSKTVKRHQTPVIMLVMRQLLFLSIILLVLSVSAFEVGLIEKRDKDEDEEEKVSFHVKMLDVIINFEEEF